MTPTKNDAIAADQKLIDGIQKFLSSFSSLPVGGPTIAPGEIVKVLQGRIDAIKASNMAAINHAAAIKAVRDGRAKSAPLLKALRRLVQGMYLDAPDTLAIFGLAPPKVTNPTVATKAAAVVKSKATRTARGTVSKKAKEAIHGTTPVVAGKPSAPTS